MIEPYYQHSGKCECGCGENISNGNRFINHHNLRCLKRTEEHRKRISMSQKKAWKTKRKRMPIGSTWIDFHGYRRVKIKIGKAKWPYEHIVLMEKYLNRKLGEKEIVHHINGKRDDNRIENLFVCKNLSEHNKIEKTFKILLKNLIDDGHVSFNKKDEKYYYHGNLWD